MSKLLEVRLARVSCKEGSMALVHLRLAFSQTV